MGRPPTVGGADLFSLASGLNASSLLPPPGAFLPPSGLLPFAPHPTDLTIEALRPDLALKNGLNPYDFGSLGRSFQSDASSVDALSVRLSPTSSGRSLSPSPISKKEEIKTNCSEVNSTDELHSNGEDSDDETIEVVKSAFHPARPASLELRELKRRQMEGEMQHPDSTVQDRPKHGRNELKAPVVRPTRVGSASPTSTKLTSATVSAQKSVWRPY